MDRKASPELDEFILRMQARGISQPAQQAFCRLYQLYRAGDTGKFPWSEVEPLQPQGLVLQDELSTPACQSRGAALLDQLVVIRVNGGIGTTMKLTKTKSLIPVREGRSFLEISLRQIEALRESFGARVPLLLMNSQRTRAECAPLLAGRGLEVDDLPLDFLQQQAPRIERATGRPTGFADEEQNFAPPGHGDIYLSLEDNGLLDELLRRGYRWAFLSNVDNLGATVDPGILGYLDRQGLDFAMEVADKSPADVKGGTLVRRNGQLTLLEVAQLEDGHLADFKDRSLFPVFNSNNIWLRLDSLRRLLDQGPLQLPLIVNPKTVQGVELVQLETAMGAAISCFERARGIRIPRSRFAPVKATDDLLAVRSDAYVLDEGWGLRPNPARDRALGPPVIQLDPRFFKALGDFEERVPAPLSLVRCEQLSVAGDVHFGPGVVIEGKVALRYDGQVPYLVPAGTVFTSGEYQLRR